MKRLGNIVTVRVSLLVFLTLVIAFPLNCTKKEPETKEIKIGAILSLTGSAAMYGKWSQNGIELAIDEMNNNGGFNGRSIKVIFEDDISIPSSAVSAAKKLIEIDGVKAILGPLTSSSVLAAAPVAEAKRVVLLSPCASSPKITEAGDYIFRNWPSDDFEGAAMAEFLAQQLHVTKVIVMAMNNEYGLGLQGVFIRRAKELGLEILGVLSFEQGATDFRTQAAQIGELKPDAVYLPGHAKEVAMIIRQCHEIGVKTIFTSGVAFGSPDVFTIAGNAAEGTYYTAPFFDPNSPNKEVRIFEEAYKARFHAEAEVFAAHAYDATKILVTALQHVGGDANRLKDALYLIRDFPGVTGNTTFDKNGDVIKPVAVKVVKGGTFQLWQETKNFP
ncbi:MAG TPA: ABC transporter substrate-binding protein [Desulfosporosinus sp.]|nr:ABC transporter substrate-binding protein [Desulfosporosinus sp.]